MKKTLKVSEQVHQRLTEFRDAEEISSYSDAILVLLEREVNNSKDLEGEKEKAEDEGTEDEVDPRTRKKWISQFDEPPELRKDELLS